jgi:phenylalanyl-tRNA synthetase alpha chain
MFHQLEGLLVDKNVSITDLKGTLLFFVQQMFGTDRKIRLRPHHFPFTEPSFEVDVSCGLCGGKGCRSCKNSGWLEILGAGMVHPNVLENAGIYSSIYSGFAFGMGIERIVMLKYGVDDMRMLYSGDLRFVEQF